jgi:capsular polysaccharide biosynthesis protein
MKQFLRRILYSAKPHICTDVALWARAKGLPVLEIYPPIDEEIAKIAAIDAVAKSEFVLHRADLKRPQTLVVLDRAVVRDSTGFVRLPDGSFCQQGTWFRPYLEQHPSYKARFRRKRFLSGSIYSLLGLWSGEFYHWFHDTLPRLLTALPHLPSDTRFLIYDNPRSYQLESLEALGIGPDRLESQWARGDTVVESLWFATPIGHSTFTSGRVLRLLAQRLQKAFGARRGDPANGRLYISRHRAQSRRIDNEAAIAPLLRESGFSFITCEDLSYSDQVKVFTSAKYVIGPHGAGLMNTIFCRPGSKVGEINSGANNPCYLAMANQLGLSFSRFGATCTDSISNRENMNVDLDVFTQQLGKFVGEAT